MFQYNRDGIAVAAAAALAARNQQQQHGSQQPTGTSMIGLGLLRLRPGSGFICLSPITTDLRHCSVTLPDPLQLTQMTHCG